MILERRPCILVKFSLRELCDSKSLGLHTFDNNSNIIESENEVKNRKGR